MVGRASLAAWQSDGANSSIRNSAVGTVITELADVIAKLAAAHAGPTTTPAIVSEPVKMVVVMNARM
jgi:hypothetical protein